VDTQKCIGCGICAEKCPKKVHDPFNENLGKRKAIYVEYAQAVPLKYAIDQEHCIYFDKRKCRACEKFCPKDAINFEDKEESLILQVGAIILAPGSIAFDPTRYPTYKHAKHPNVVTSMEFERILSATGPYQGHLKRPSDQKEPKKIAWLQCVGSRDLHHCDNSYCSSVCCMYSIKEAIVAKEHAEADIDCAIFFMDMRTHGKDFETYFNNAREKNNIRFVRARVPTVECLEGSDDLLIPYVNEKEEIIEEPFDMVVLSVGLEMAPEVVDLAQKLGVDLTEGQFCKTESFRPVKTSREGIYVCGAFNGPKDIPQSVIEASAAAAETCVLLSEARNTLTREKEISEEKDVMGLEPRIGVFVCHCGINIAGIVRVTEVAEYAKTLPHVAYVQENLFSCSQDALETLKQRISEYGLNRVVVAACSPRTHEPLFQETLINSGLNKYLFEMTNIRNQDSWVHQNDPDAATLKAKDLVRMAVAKVALSEPLLETAIEVNPRVLVVGGGISGMIAAKSLADQGYNVSIVERSSSLGGQALSLFKTWKGEDVQQNLANLVESVKSHIHIDLHLSAELSAVEGFVGNFKTTLTTHDKEEVVRHGVTVIATGAKELKPDEYHYGKNPRVVTHTELDWKFIANDPSLKEIQTAVFIQCVGSREPDRPYCSRVCCTHSIESALHLKEMNPSMNIYILYRDIRTYGEREYLYRKARLAGILFIPFSKDQKPEVRIENDSLEIGVVDHLLERKILLKADLLVLASAIIPYKDEKLSQLYKIPMNREGFFVEAHAKLAPSEFATEGVFLCGMAHYPKPIDESIAQALAAASRAATILSQKHVRASGLVSEIDPERCVGCQGCLDVCPFGAINFFEDRHVCQVNRALCKGCGACAAACPSSSVQLMGSTSEQIYAQIRKALSG
jgi:heterodisulfide reductase subunit A